MKKTVKKKTSAKDVKRNQKSHVPTKRSSPTSGRAGSRSAKNKKNPVASVKRNKEFMLPELPRKSSLTRRGSDKDAAEAKPHAVKRSEFIVPLECEKETHYSVMNLDGNLMAGVLHEPARQSKTLVILIHGWKSNKEKVHTKQLAIDLSRAGFTAFRFDLSGNGDSEGRFEDAVPSKLLRDVTAVAEHFRKRFTRIILLGHSLGGSLALIAASRVKVDGLVVVSGAMHPEDFADRKLTQQQQKELISVGFTTITRKTPVGEIPYIITDQFVREIRALHPLERAMNVFCPVLIVHGTEDKEIPSTDSEELFQVLRQKDLLLIGGADHGFTNPEHLDALISGIIEWVKKLR